MSRKFFALATPIAAMGFGLVSCDSDDNGSGDTLVRAYVDTQADLPLVSPDGRDPVDAIMLRVTTFRMHSDDEGWFDLSPGRHAVDLLDPVVLESDIARGVVPDGTYDQLRLVVADARIVIAGQAHPLDIPSGETSGFKIHGAFCIGDDRTEQVVLGWDLVDGLHHNPARGYWLVPSVQLADEQACEGFEDDAGDDDDIADDGPRESAAGF